MTGAAGARLLRRGDPGWPAGMDDLDDPPALLHVLGRLPLDAPAVAVVGPRRATDGGLRTATEIGRDLGHCGITVVSGMALGADGAAHRGALLAGGRTVAVLGCGVDVAYPAVHAALRDRIAASGAVLSEHPPGTTPWPANFPRRNRLIAALSVAVIVVEAAPDSGALSTARWAADLGRDLLACPGSSRNPLARGCIALLRDGVAPYEDVRDLAAVVPSLADRLAPLTAALDAHDRDWRRRRGRRRRSPPTTPPGTAGDPDAAILDLAAGSAVHPDSLVERLGIGAPEVAGRIVALELAGRLRRVPGGVVAVRAGWREGPEWVYE